MCPRFVLLKERNMLLTTLQAYEDATEQMPNEERIDKVAIYVFDFHITG